MRNSPEMRNMRQETWVAKPPTVKNNEQATSERVRLTEYTSWGEHNHKWVKTLSEDNKSAHTQEVKQERRNYGQKVKQET